MNILAVALVSEKPVFQLVMFLMMMIMMIIKVIIDIIQICFKGSVLQFFFSFLFLNFRRVFPPSLLQPTLSIMGLFQTKGPIMPIVEMQARWAVQVFGGKQL